MKNNKLLAMALIIMGSANANLGNEPTKNKKQPTQMAQRTRSNKNAGEKVDASLDLWDLSCEEDENHEIECNYLPDGTPFHSMQ
jgi:hypothetical protein